jgi:hypothetical protein
MTRLPVTLALLIGLSVTALADRDRSIESVNLHAGAVLHVERYSIWFNTEQQLYVWQRLQRTSSPNELKIYRDLILRSRGAFQFGNKLRIEIVKYDSAVHEVEVRMLPTGGKFDNTIWWIDDKDCTK